MLILPLQRFLMSGAWRAEALREFFQFLALQERRGVPLAESLDHLQARRSKKVLLASLRWAIQLSLIGMVILTLLLAAIGIGNAFDSFLFPKDLEEILSLFYLPLVGVFTLCFLESSFLDLILTTEDYGQELAARLFVHVSKGVPLSQAMRRARGWFPWPAADLVAAGEETGQMAETLDDLANYLKADQTVPYTEWALVFYPFPTVVLALSLLSGILVFIMPKFVAIFTEMGMEMPGPTAWVINHRFEGFGAVLGGSFLFMSLVALTNSRFVDRYGISALLSRLPFLNLWVRPLILSQFLLVLGRFLRVHLPLPDALQKAGELVQGSSFSRVAERAGRRVQQGLTLSKALETESSVPAGIRQMVRLAEHNETLPERCLELAQSLREKWFFRTQRLTRIVEPLSLLLVGLLVGAMALALYLPLFNMTTAMSNRLFQ
ncbi:MAG TPA: type II secretion system F family protein [Candidatus Sumerlaeota bacterium]|nr:type II secretion system F family protein [Candidatus Sumerlaeota bacterium]